MSDSDSSSSSSSSSSSKEEKKEVKKVEEKKEEPKPKVDEKKHDRENSDSEDESKKETEEKPKKEKKKSKKSTSEKSPKSPKKSKKSSHKKKDTEAKSNRNDETSSPKEERKAVSQSKSETESKYTFSKPEGAVDLPKVNSETPMIEKDSKDAKEKPGCIPKKGEQKEKPKTVPMSKLFHFAEGVDYLLIVLGCLGGLAHGAIMPCFSFILGGLIDALNFTTPDGVYREVSKLALWFVYLGLMSFGSYWLQYTCLSIAATRQVKRLREAYLAAMLKQDIAWFDATGTGALTERISSDTTIIEEALGAKLGDLLRFESTFIAGFVMGFVQGWKLTLVLIAVTPAIAIAGGFMMKLLASFSQQGQTAYADAGAVANEVISGIKTVASFGGERKEHARYEVNLEKAARIGIKKGFIAGGGLGTTFLLIFCTYSLALWYGGELVIKDNYNGGQVLTVLFSVIFGAFALGQASPSMQKLAEAQGAAYKLFETIDRKPVIDALARDGKKLDNVKGNIELKNIKFKYPTRPDVEVLKGLNLSIKEGQMVALVGPSGCGKSSTISLIQRFYDVEEGEITIDGTNVKDLNLRWWRQQIGLVSQEPVLFAGTIAENISYGRKGASREEIVEAAKFANAHNFIEQFPDKYDTFVGEKGAQLSGGQKQRVAIARAILKNPKLLLLDEATSALDSESEKIVQEALDRVMKGRTTIVIAHRLSTIRDANVIAVINQGQVAELGTHDELMDKDGLYAELVKLQGGGAKQDKKEKKKKKKEDKLRATMEKKTETVGKVGGEEEEKLYEVSLGRLFALNKKEIPHILFGCLVASMNGALNPVFAIIFSEIVDLYYQSAADIRNDVKYWIGGFIGLGILACFINIFQAGLFGYAGEKLTYRLRSLAFKSIIRQDMAFFDKPEHLPSVLTSNLSQDATLVQGLLGARMALSVQNIVTIIAGLVIAFDAGWKLTLVLLALSPAMMFASVMEMLSFKGLGQKSKKATSQANQIATEAIGNIRTVAAFTSEARTLNKYQELLQRPYNLSIRKDTLSGFLVGLGEFLMFSAQALSFWYGGVLIRDGEYSFVQVMKVFMAIFMSAMSIGQASAMGPDGAKAKRAASSIFSIVDSVPAVDPYSEEGRAPSGKGEITLKNIEFTYPSRPDAQIFKGLNLTVKPGHIVALVGPSGCGKSSVVSLIERFYSPQGGDILVDGENIKDINVKELRKMIGLVGQEPVLFKGSIAENIAYGRPEATFDEIKSAAKAANAHKFIESFPNKYDTEVGEKGTQLSGGQKQRIAIARAILKDPKILLLDEATSALDTESEKVVQKALDRVMKGRTTIVIAHRLSTIRNADQILVFSGGKIVEQGTHEELIEKGGLYFSLVERQQR